MRTSFSTKLAMILALTVGTGAVFADPATEKAATQTETKAADAAITINDSTVVLQATVEGQKIEITFGQLKEQLNALPPQVKNAPMQEIYPFLLENAYKLAVIKAKAQKLGLDKDEAVKKSIAQCQEAMLQKAYLDKKVEERQTEVELKKAYDEVIKVLPPTDQVRLKQATFMDKKAAEAFLKAATNDGFDKALENAKKANPEQQGGEIDKIRVDNLPPELAAEVKKAAKATLIKKVITLEANGAKIFLVTKVENKEPAEKPTYEQLKEELKMLLSQKLMKEVLDDATKDVKVEKRIGLDGKDLPEPTAPAAAAAPKAEETKEEKKEEKKS